MTDDADTSSLLVVGSYTDAYGDFRATGDGLSLVALESDGTMRTVHNLNLVNPSFVRVMSRDLIGVVVETETKGEVVLVKVDRVGRRLVPVRRIAVPGAIPCHLDIHPSGKWLGVPCYGSGHVCIFRSNSEATAAPTDVVCHTGRGIHPVRQRTAHPHCVCFSPDGRWVLVPDLGTDDIVIYPFDENAGTLGTPRRWKAPEGSGPRLVLFSRSGRHVLLVHELSCEVSSLSWAAGDLSLVQRISAIPDGASARNTTAGLRWHPVKSQFGVTNRGGDDVVLFAFDSSVGGIKRIASLPSGGKKPRDFDFLPCRDGLVVANQDSDSIILYERAGQAGMGPGFALAIRSPSSVRHLG